MNNTDFALKREWVRSFDEPVYSASIANLVGTSTPQVVGCSFSRILRAYTIEGKEVFQTPFLPDISQFMAASLTNADRADLIAGDTHGYVRLINLQGKLIWKRKLGSPVTCMDIGDTVGDPKKEVIVGLANNYIALLDHLGEIIFAIDAPHPVLDVTLGKLPDQAKQGIIVLFANGEVAQVDYDNKWTTLFTIKNQPSCFTYLKIYDTSSFLIGTKEGKVQLVDLTGDPYCEYKCDEAINDITKEIVKIKGEDRVYICFSSGNNLNLFRLKIPSKSLLFASKHEFVPFPNQHHDLSQNLSIESSNYKQTIPELNGKRRIKCRECGEYSPSSLKDPIIKGLDVYCEFCGAKLSVRDF